ncbi:MAG: heme NO-binding domain-containing protein [Steroidobacteraceae bacterium]
MYGLVNKAIEQMVCRDHGDGVWQLIKQQAGVEVEAFVSNAAYPDDVTYRLVGAACRVLDTTPDRFLSGFGEYWVLHTALESYGPLMRAHGKTAREFILKLPVFHARVQMIFPELRPPEFECTDVTEESLMLHYRTPRPAGLEPFVEGLIRGIGEMFGDPLDLRRVEDRSTGAEHSVFHVTWRKR